MVMGAGRVRGTPREVAKLARKVDQLAEVDAIMRGVDAPDGARQAAERRVARRSRHLQAVK
jgi:hypothetical protein